MDAVVNQLNKAIAAEETRVAELSRALAEARNELTRLRRSRQCLMPPLADNELASAIKGVLADGALTAEEVRKRLPSVLNDRPLTGLHKRIDKLLRADSKFTRRGDGTWQIASPAPTTLPAPPESVESTQIGKDETDDL